MCEAVTICWNELSRAPYICTGIVNGKIYNPPSQICETDFLNTNNVYEIRICKENVDVELLDQLRENRLTFRIHFVKEDEEKLVCYTTLGGMKRLSQKKHNNFHHI